MAEKMTLKEQAKKIIEIAEKSGVQSNFLFLTTFKRYQVQLDILDELEHTIREEDLLVEKEYVKDAKNRYVNPAVQEYNRTTDSANKTVGALMRIIKAFNVSDKKAEEDPLLAILNGGTAT